VKERFANPENQEIEEEGGKNPPKILQAKIERSKDRIDANGKLRSKGFGFVEFQDHAHALAALRQLNNNPSYYGAAKRLTVEFALENVLILRKREERFKKIQDKQGTPVERASKATEKRKARRERREDRLRLEKVTGKKTPLPEVGNGRQTGKKQPPQQPEKSKSKSGQQQPESRPVKKATKPSAASTKPSAASTKPSATSTKPSATSTKPSAASATKSKGKPQETTQQRLPKKRKRDQEEEKFQKMVNSYKQKLFKSDDSGSGSMSRWMS